MTKHTPGPWEDWEAANGDDDPAPYRIDGQMIDRKSEVVAWVYREHDARLIAAAPELLAALFTIESMAINDRSKWARTIAAEARAAIAKATEGQS